MNCLVLLSSIDSSNHALGAVGVSAACCKAAFTKLSSCGIDVVIATEGGKIPSIMCEDAATEEWHYQNKQLFNSPIKLEDVIPAQFCGMFIPTGLGAVCDLAKNKVVGELVSEFISGDKPICAIGNGVAALLPANTSSGEWLFSGWTMTAASNFEQARHPYFAQLPVIVEDAIRERGGSFSSGAMDSLFVAVDRILVTGQNVASTTIAVQNLIYLSEH